MIYKYLLPFLCIFLVGCASKVVSPHGDNAYVLQEKKEYTFEGDYSRISRDLFSSSQSGIFSTIENFYEELYPSGYDTSMIRLAFDNPSTASGDISISADAARETYKKLSAKMTLTGSLHTQDANIEFKDIRANIMADASASRYYGFLEALDIGGSLISEFEKDIMDIQKYKNKWWIVDYSTLLSSQISGIMADSTSTDMRDFVIIYTNLLEDISKNGTNTILPIIEKNPILATTSSGTQDGDMNIYPIVLSQSGIVGFIDSLYRQYSSTGISDSAVVQIEKSFSGI